MTRCSVACEELQAVIGVRDIAAKTHVRLHEARGPGTTVFILTQMQIDADPASQPPGINDSLQDLRHQSLIYWMERG